jgi:hypothetical protein
MLIGNGMVESDQDRSVVGVKSWGVNECMDECT